MHLSTVRHKSKNQKIVVVAGAAGTTGTTGTAETAEAADDPLYALAASSSCFNFFVFEKQLKEGGREWLVDDI